MADLRTQLGDEDDDDEPEHLQFKVIILGDGAVGKTSLSSRFCEDHFAKHYKQTIGLDFFVKRLTLTSNVNVCLQIWDTGGQSIGGKMVGNYIHGSHAVVLVYDITNYQSFQHLEDWLCLVTRTFGQERMPYMALMANKSDLSHIRAVRPEKHDQFAEENDLYSYSVSSKTGENVHQTFYRIAADLAGVTLSKSDLEVVQKPTKAELVDYQRNDPQYSAAHASDVARDGTRRCAIM